MSAPASRSGPSLWQRFRYNVSDSVVVAQRNLMRYVRLPQLLVFSTIQPVMFVLLFNFVFGGALFLPPDVDAYIDFLMAGILVQTVLFGATQATVGLAEDLSGGMVDRFRSLPMGRAAVMAGRTMADSLRNVFVVLLMLGVGALIGFRVHDGLWPAVAAVVLVVAFGFAISWISAFLGLITRDPETAQVAGFIWVFPLVFASSAFVPVETMPDWLRAFAEVQPISVTVDTVRALFLGRPLDTLWLALAWIAGILVVFVPLSIRQYRRSV